MNLTTKNAYNLGYLFLILRYNTLDTGVPIPYAFRI